MEEEWESKLDELELAALASFFTYFHNNWLKE